MSPLVYVVMGVSGCGKSTVASLLAERLGCPFYEGDSFHPVSNVTKMQAGVPLSDEDRWPWLNQLAAIIQRHLAARQPAVLSCSALKPAYRALLRTGRREVDGSCGGSSAGTADGQHSGDVAFVLLDPPRALLEERLQKRTAHFMAASLLDSQLAALQFEDCELAARFGSGSSGGSGTFPDAEQVVEAIVGGLSGMT